MSFAPEDIDVDGAISDNWRIDWNDLKNWSKIGGGNYGNVYKAEYQGATVAVKELVEPDEEGEELDEEEMALYYVREMACLKELDHPNIVKLLGLCKHEGVVHIITEFVAGGDLRARLKNRNIKLTWYQRAKICLDIGRSLSYLHTKQIMHRDLKSKNLLVRDLADGEMEVCACDFGFARKMAPKHEYMTLCVPEDHEILTSEGFMDLDEFLARRDDNLLVAGYDQQRDQMVMEKPTALLQYPREKRELVEFSDVHEMLDTWNANSGPYGNVELDASSSHSASDVPSGLSYLTTGDHMVLCQRGNFSGLDGDKFSPISRTVAARLNPGEQPRKYRQVNGVLPPSKIAAKELLQGHYDGVRHFAVATNGIRADSNVVMPYLESLGLLNVHEDSFLELFGFWLGDGSMAYGDSANGGRRPASIRFGQHVEADQWLRVAVPQAGLRTEDWQICEQENTSATPVTIFNRRWVEFFHDEYGHKYNRPLVAQSMASAESAEAVPSADTRRLSDADPFSKVSHTNFPIDISAPSGAPTGTSIYDLTSSASGSFMQPEDIERVKWFPSWAWLLDRRRLRLIIEGLRKANGREASQKMAIRTPSARFRDEVLRVLLMAGYSATFRCENSAAGTERSLIYVIMYCEPTSEAGKRSCWPVSSRLRGEIRSREVTSRVWCLTMPSGFLWTRRVHKEHGVVTKASRPVVTGNCGTDEWMAPEVMLGQKYDAKADVYSFGMVMVEVVTREKPLQRLNESAPYNYEKFRNMTAPDCPYELFKITILCSQFYPVNRPTTNEAVAMLEKLVADMAAGPVKSIADIQAEMAAEANASSASEDSSFEDSSDEGSGEKLTMNLEEASSEEEGRLLASSSSSSSSSEEEQQKPKQSQAISLPKPALKHKEEATSSDTSLVVEAGDHQGKSVQFLAMDEQGYVCATELGWVKPGVVSGDIVKLRAQQQAITLPTLEEGATRMLSPRGRTASKGLGQLLSKLKKEEAPAADFEMSHKTVVETVLALASEVSFGVRKKMLKTQGDSVTGQELVEWLVASKRASSASAAGATIDHLLSCGALRGAKMQFDKNALYQSCLYVGGTPEMPLMNAGLVWERGTREPVALSYDLARRFGAFFKPSAPSEPLKLRKDGAFARLMLDTCELQNVGLEELSDMGKLAFWTNVHNMMVMHALVVRGEPKDKAERRALREAPMYKIGGVEISARLIENMILTDKVKADAKDTRASLRFLAPKGAFLMGLWDGTQERARLRAYTEHNFEQEVTENLRAWLMNGVVSVDKSFNTITLPRIFKTHQAAFGKDLLVALESYLTPETQNFLLGLKLAGTTAEVKFL